MAEQKSEQLAIRSVMEDPSAQAIARTMRMRCSTRKATGVELMLEELGSFVDDVLLKVPGLQRRL